MARADEPLSDAEMGFMLDEGMAKQTLAPVRHLIYPTRRR